jgi:predicted protein tyrosine phosphatase
MTKVLFICGKARKRSPTAVEVASNWPELLADFGGLSKDADERVTQEQLEWADVVMVMEHRQKARLRNIMGPLPSHTKAISMNIPDNYDFMDETLVDILKRKLTHHFGPPQISAGHET